MSLVQAKCTNCGANIEVNPQNDAGICPYCHTAYITQKAIVNYNTTIINNNIIQAETVNIVGGNFDNLIKIAKEAWEGANYSEAHEKFSKALEINPADKEALLYNSLCVGWEQSNFQIILNTFHKVFDGVDYEIATNAEIEQLNYFLTELNNLVNVYDKTTYNLYETNFCSEENLENIWSRVENVIAALSMMIDFQEKIKDKSEIYLEYYLDYLHNLVICYHDMSEKWYYNAYTVNGGQTGIKVYHPDKRRYEELQKEATQKIKEYEPDYQPPEKEGCYIATAVYGSYDCPPVWVLRRYRDEKLGRSSLGRIFIKFYYAISPTLVKWFGNSKWFQNFWKIRLNHFVERLKNEGFDDTPYQDKDWRVK